MAVCVVTARVCKRALRWMSPLLLGSVCALATGACGAFSDPPEHSVRGQHSVSPSPLMAEKDEAGLIVRVPDIEQVISGSIPAEVAKGRYWKDPFNRRTEAQHFSWKVFDAQHNRDLTLDVTRKADVAKAKAKAAYVENDLANDRVREGRQVVDTGPIEKVADLADECLGFSISRKNAMSAIPGDDGQKYSMSGRYLYCRFKNVNIVVDWEGFDYSRPWKLDAGTGMNQASSERDVERIVRTIVSTLR